VCEEINTSIGNNHMKDNNDCLRGASLRHASPMRLQCLTTGQRLAISGMRSGWVTPRIKTESFELCKSRVNVTCRKCTFLFCDLMLPVARQYAITKTVCVEPQPAAGGSTRHNISQPSRFTVHQRARNRRVHPGLSVDSPHTGSAERMLGRPLCHT
jgi:hypothetical protein